MALIQWNNSLSVGVAEIDKQHQKLVSIINELHEAALQGKGKDVLGKILSDLMEYTKTHFDHEEKLLERCKYPEIVSHKTEHTNFILKIMEYKKGLDEGRLTLTLQVMNFLSDWLQNHIKGTDKKYSQCLNDQGVK